MRCSVCGSDINPDGYKCNNCGHLYTEVQVLTPEEKKRFQGITIEQNGNNEEYQYNERHHNHRGDNVYGKYRVYNIGGGMSTWLLPLLILVISFFIALPLLLLVAAVFTIGFLLKRVLR